MKGHVGRSSNLGRLIPYVLREQTSEGRVQASRIVSGTAPTVRAGDLIAEFKAVAGIRPDIRRPYWHCSMAVNQETLSRRQWAHATVAVLEAMEFDLRLHPYVAVQHQKDGLDHCHVVVSRVGVDGSVWAGEWEVFNFIEACQLVERRMGLKVTPALRAARLQATDPSRGQRTAESRSVIRSNWRAERRRQGKNDGKKLVRDLRACAARAFDMESFVALARDLDIEVKIVECEDRARPGVLVKERSAGTYLSLSSVTHGELSWPILEDLFVAKAKREDNCFGDELDDPETDHDENAEDWQDDELLSPNESHDKADRESE